MTVVYLGLFQRVFEWVLSHILEPVYRFVSNLLMTVFTWIFQELLAPILMDVLKEAMQFFVDLWLQLYSMHLYLLFSSVLKLIDYLQTAFDVFIGLKDVTYTQADGTVISGSLVEVLLQQKTVSTVFWLITLGALGLALILTIYATAKSAFDLDFENKRPVSKVLAAMMKTFIQFFTVPFLVYFLLKLAAVILKGVTTALSFTGSTTLGRIVFTIASLDAAKNETYNLSTASGGITLGTSNQDIIRYPFYTTEGNGISLKDYADLSAVMEDFNLGSFDYLIGFIAAIFLLFTIGVCLIVFVQRIFELILLYIVSPYFVCIMPLDDGEKFSRWREMFVGKCFTGFGSAIGMRLFLMICPMVMGNQIRFGTASSPEMDYMMKLFFLAGGAWAVYKSGSMLTSILSSQAGMAEANTSAMAGGMLYGYTVGAAINKGTRALGSAFGGRGGKAGPGGPAGGGNGAAGPGFSGKNGLGGGMSAGEGQRFKGLKGHIARGVLRSSAVNGSVRSSARLAAGSARAVAGVTGGLGKAAGGIGWAAGKLSGTVGPGTKQNAFRRASGQLAGRANAASSRLGRVSGRFGQAGNVMEGIRQTAGRPGGIYNLAASRQAEDGGAFRGEGAAGAASIGGVSAAASEAASAPVTGAAAQEAGMPGSSQGVRIEIGRHRLMGEGSGLTADEKGNVSSWRFAAPGSRWANGAGYQSAASQASGGRYQSAASQSSGGGYQSTASRAYGGKYKGTASQAYGSGYKPMPRQAISPAPTVRSVSGSAGGVQVKHSDVSIKGLNTSQLPQKQDSGSVKKGASPSGAYNGARRTIR